MQVDWLIVGAGYCGAVLAERIATQLNQTVLVVDKRAHIAGNAFDYYDDHGILVHKYGPHIFHTNSEKVWSYLSSFTSWRPYFHRVRAVVEGKDVPVPFNLNSLHQLFPAKLAQATEDLLLEHCEFGAKIPILKLRESPVEPLRFLADYIYNNVFHGYTVKQWGMTPEELGPSVTARVPVFVSRDDRYFQDRYQALPAHGYTRMFERMLNHPNIHLLLQTDYRKIAESVKFKRMVYTGPIDEFFDHMHGHLPYRSLRFELHHSAQSEWQSVGQVNYPNEYDFTRITEFRYLTGQVASGTTVAVEFPIAHQPGMTDPYYPIPREENTLLYNKYRQEADKMNGNVMFVGRLADYKYYNMDQAVGRALSCFEKEIAPMIAAASGR